MESIIQDPHVQELIREWEDKGRDKGRAEGRAGLEAWLEAWLEAAVTATSIGGCSRRARSR